MNALGRQVLRKDPNLNDFFPRAAGDAEVAVGGWIREVMAMCYIARMIQATLKTEKLVREVLREVRELRQEVSFIIPTESVSGYAHPRRLLASYRRAIKRHPPRKG